MLEYITSNDYFKLLGKSVPNDFKKLVIEASTFINSRTFGRIDKDNVPDEVKFVTCLIIDNLALKESKKSEAINLKSESLEGWSRTYATPLEIERDFEHKNSELLNQYLWNVIGKDGNPLLYTGVC